MSLIARKFTDIDLNFEAHPVTKDILRKRDENAIAQSIKSLLLTSHYERPYNPDLGSNLKRFLFEPIDNVTTTLIQDSIFETLKNYEPRIEIEQVVAAPNFDLDQYDVTVTFYVRNVLEPITISFFLERIR
jgi:phage baseplate assembly protein W